MEKGGAPRQGLGNDLSQLQLVRAGEHKLPGTIPFVDDRLQVAEQMWGSLDLVKDNFTSVRFKESAGIVGGKGAQIRILKRNVFEMRKRRSGEGGFSGLPGAEHGHDWKFRQLTPKFL